MFPGCFPSIPESLVQSSKCHALYTMSTNTPRYCSILDCMCGPLSQIIFYTLIYWDIKCVYPCLPPPRAFCFGLLHVRAHPCILSVALVPALSLGGFDCMCQNISRCMRSCGLHASLFTGNRIDLVVHRASPSQLACLGYAAACTRSQSNKSEIWCTPRHVHAGASIEPTYFNT